MLVNNLQRTRLVLSLCSSLYQHVRRDSCPYTIEPFDVVETRVLPFIE